MKHLLERGVIVIHILGEPLLGEPLFGHGLLIELDVHLCEEVVLGLITCEEETAQGIYYLTSVKLNGRRNCSSTMKFFLLRLDRFIQFLYTSSVIIGLDFVFSNLPLTISEDLIALSVQESPNLFAFRVLSLNFVTWLVTCVTANNGFSVLS